MNRQELEQFFTEALKPKLLGLMHDKKKILDVKVRLAEVDWQDEECGGTYETIKISVQVSTPKGRFLNWEEYYY